MMAYLTALLLLGALVALSALKVVLAFFWRHFLRPAKDLKTYGQWAVVTGATDGIGKAYAFELARKGQSVLLISRTQSKLNATAEELLAKHPGVEVRTLAVDFSSFGAGDPQHANVAAAIDGLDVGVLINNVGMSYPYCQYFHELADDEVAKLLQLNVNSTTFMTRLVLPGMLERGRGAVVNVSSSSGLVPTPLLAQYSATKAYTDFLAQSLAAEYAGKGIFFQCQSPLWVTTKLAKIRRSSLTVPTPKTYAKAAVATIGHDQDSVAYWVHDVMAGAMIFLNKSLPGTYAGGVLNMHLGIRKRGLRKKEKQAQEAKEGKKDA